MKKILLMICLSVFLPAIAQAVDFSFTDLDGKTYQSGDLKGSPMVINVGAHWWNKCKKEAPELQRAFLQYKDKGVLFLGVFASKDKEIKEFADEFHLTFPVGKENGIATTLGVKAIPETLFIGKDGQIVSRYSGTINFDELAAGIEALL